jgi:hypothetical protein
MLEHLNVGSSVAYAGAADKGQTRSIRRVRAATVRLSPFAGKGFSEPPGIGPGDAVVPQWIRLLRVVDL